MCSKSLVKDFSEHEKQKAAALSLLEVFDGSEQSLSEIRARLVNFYTLPSRHN